MTDTEIGTVHIARGDDTTLAAALNSAHASGYTLDVEDLELTLPPGWLTSPATAASIHGQLRHAETGTVSLVGWSVCLANGDVIIVVSWSDGYRAVRRVAGLDWAEEQAFDGDDPPGELAQWIDHLWTGTLESMAAADRQARGMGL